MKRKTLLILIITLLIVSCSHSAQLSEIKWIDVSADELAGPELLFGNLDVCLEVNGLHALSYKSAILYGSFSSDHQDIRSVILKTIDGGLTWEETMFPVRGASVSHAYFIENTGWVLVFPFYVTEYINPLFVYRTEDKGSTWSLVSEFELQEYDISGLGFPRNMKFQDKLNGEISVLVGGYPDAGIAYFYTRDGGRTWEVDSELQEYEIQPSEPIGDSFWYTSTGYDGSEWGYKEVLHLDTEGGNKRKIETHRWKGGNEFWYRTYQMPNCFGFVDGYIIHPEVTK